MGTPSLATTPFRTGGTANPWDRPGAVGERLSVPEAAPAEGTAGERPLDRAYRWLEDQAAELLAHPQQQAPALRTALAEAVRSLGVRASEAAVLMEQLEDQLLGAGALAPYFRDPTVTEILVNGAAVFVERQGRLEPAPHLGSPAEGIRVAQHLARHEGREYRANDPLMNFIWSADGSRVNIVHHSKTATGVAIAIRKRQTGQVLDLATLIAARSLTGEAADLLQRALRGRLNVLLAGPQGSGKTELLRALAMAVIDPTERVGTIEDAPELHLTLPDLVALVGLTDPPTAEQRAQGAVSQDDLFRNTLRMRLDRLLFGELRGPEALAFLEALMSAAGGSLTTMHAYAPELIPARFYHIAHKHGIALPYDLIQEMVYGTLAVIVQLTRDPSGHRHVAQIVEVAPGGRMSPLFHWDAAQGTVVRVGALSAAREAWIATHAAGAA